jgi:hypothetical protein
MKNGVLLPLAFPRSTPILMRSNLGCYSRRARQSSSTLAAIDEKQLQAGAMGQLGCAKKSSARIAEPRPRL